MDLFQLRCFVAVCEELHFGKAAVRLHMTQPPLSRQIQLLEDSVGARLLERTSRSVALTAAGTVLYKDALKLLKLADAAVANARLTASGDSGRVTVGYTAVSGYVLIPQLLLQAQQALPGIEIVLEEMVSSQQLRALADEALDLAFVRPLASEADLLYHRVVREPMQLALPASHALAGKRRITLADLAGQPLIMYSQKEGQYFHDKIKNLFAATGVQPRYVHHMGQTHAIVALVQAGIGVAIVPASARHLYFEQVEFRDLWRRDVVAEIYLAWRRAERNPAQRRLREFILKTLGAGSAPGTEPEG
nr:LysR family transcriptional regulator [Azohydromonas aeria]